MRRVVLKTPKTDDSIRSDYLTAFVVDVLRRHRARQVERLGRELREDDFVFTRYDGRPWDPNEMSRIFTRTIRGKNLTAKRLKAIRLHDLRHAFASLSFATGVPLKLVRESLGHSNIGVTSRIYTHVLPESKRQAALQRDALFSPLVPLPKG